MTVLVTGAAGFIGFHVCTALLRRGQAVVGVDNLNSYYDPNLKTARLEQLQAIGNFQFERQDVSDHQGLKALFARFPQTTGVIHLAAQAGVRHSLEDPFVYVTSNVLGQVAIIEACRALPEFKHLVYASSSSVYGANREAPFSEDHRVDKPVSMYAASKRSAELMAESYARLYGMPMTGLRFFSVYGPWGRPDMAAYIFVKAIFEGQPIKVFNHGRMKRDFTYVDDIVAGVIAALDRPPVAGEADPPHKIYNLGNRTPEDLSHFIELIETACGREAVKELEPIQLGDVPSTLADISAAVRDLGFNPRTTIEDGIPRFVEWYQAYHGT